MDLAQLCEGRLCEVVISCAVGIQQSQGGAVIKPGAAKLPIFFRRFSGKHERQVRVVGTKTVPGEMRIKLRMVQPESMAKFVGDNSRESVRSGWGSVEITAVQQNGAQDNLAGFVLAGGISGENEVRTHTQHSQTGVASVKRIYQAPFLVI